MKNGVSLFVLAAGLSGAAMAAEPALSSAERARAQALPHHATAAFELEDGQVLYGALVIAAYDDGTARVEFRGSDDSIRTVVAGSFDLSRPQLDGQNLRARVAAEEGRSDPYRNHGTVSLPAAPGVSIVETDLRVDGDGLFALDLAGADSERGPRRLRAFGRAIGTCWAAENDTLKRVADISKRPDCRRLFGHL